MKAGHPAFPILLDQLEEQHETKSASYATKNDPFSNYTKAASFIGVARERYVLGRLAEKTERIKNFLAQNNFKDGESIHETLQDIAALSLIASIMISERRGN